MLITNFAAGELAETLFGRTDLGQYYSGVSRLENFDVIPTGGISRRHGMKRMPVRDTEGNPVTLGEGRIIPFIVDREKSFLLFLAPGSISILDSDGVLLDRKESVIHPVSYGADNAFTPQEEGNTTLADIADPENGKFAEVAADETRHFLTAKYEYHADGGTWTLVEDFLLYGSMEEIDKVQYAQNFRTMVLAHKNHLPLQVTVGDSVTGIQINIQNILIFAIPKVMSTDPEIDKTIKGETDETYSQGLLQSKGNYPSCVSFFNGRLVFASTVNDRQRIFFSTSNDLYNFATYKIFLTREVSYVVILASLVKDSPIITMENPEDGSKFTEDLVNYKIGKPYFVEETRILSITGGKITVTGKANITTGLSNTERYEVEGKLLRFSTSETDSETVTHQVFDGLVYSALCVTGKSGNNTKGYNKAYIDIIPASGNYAHSIYDFTVEDNAAEYIQKNADYLVQIIKIAIYNAYRQNPSRPSNVEAAIRALANRWRIHILDTMMINFRGNLWYDLPQNLYSRMSKHAGQGQSVYLAFFTEKIIVDRYPTPDDGFTFEIASDMSDAIKWLAQNKNLLVGTETGEWVIPAGTNATNVQAVLNSRYGSDAVQATSVGDAVCFFQTGKKALVEYYIPQQDYNFRANNMAMLSKNMLHESPAFDFDFISTPYTKIFVSREDGVVVCLLYERGTGTFAWGRITTGKETEIVEDGRTVRTRTGLIKSVATIPGRAGYDDVYFIVKRGEAFFLERHSERIREDPEGDGAVFLDGYRRWDGDAAGYTADAVVYDETGNKVYPVTQEPVPDHVMWIGYPYESRVRSMPVLANDRMKQNNIKNLYIRFNDSFMPKVRSVSFEEGKERTGNTDSIGRGEPYSGIVRIPFPGVWDRDVFFELVHDRPTRCRVLAVNAEVN